MTLESLRDKLKIEQDALKGILDYMVEEHLLICNDENQYKSFDTESVFNQILSICKTVSKTKFQIFKELNMINSPDGYNIYIKPLLDSGKLCKTSGKGFGAKYLTTYY